MNHGSVPLTLGQRVAKRREHFGWTQRELAQRAKLSVTFLSEVENDRRTPGAEALRRLADAVRTSLDYLVKGVVEPSPTRPLVIPLGLAEAAEEDGWSMGETNVLLKYHRALVARRGSVGASDIGGHAPSKDDWREWYRRLFGAETHDTSL
jgi:transcriptional regulator with XRE-family HTH domain